VAHQHYKGTGRVHSFRGLLIDGDQRKIRIQGSVGAIAWRIIKCELLIEQPGAATDYESIVKVYREEQASVDAVINFDDEELLAAGFVTGNSSQTHYAQNTPAVVFDNALFVRNIWVTHSEISGSQSCNYYIELEEVKVSQAGMAQLAVASARSARKV